MAADFISSFGDGKVFDNGFLEAATMRFPDRPMRTEEQVAAWISGVDRFTPFGQRHSQGGQSLLEGGMALEVDFLQSIGAIEELSNGIAQIEVGAGATWEHLHRVLAAQDRRWAPMTHQSSPYFSVGGSLAVNCHGRDPRRAPVAESVQALRVSFADKPEPVWLERGNPTDFERMRALLGGYGAMGVILGVRLKLKPELYLRLESYRISLQKYCERALSMLGQPNLAIPEHHFAWLSCGEGEKLFDQVRAVDGIALKPPSKWEELTSENLVYDDFLSAVYRNYRDPVNDSRRSGLWHTFIDEYQKIQQSPVRMLNAMRGPTRFTQMIPLMGHGVDDPIDLMQEYFVPPAALSDFLHAARTLLIDAQDRRLLAVLSATLRGMQEDQTSLLCYSRDGTRSSLVINFRVSRRAAQEAQSQAMLAASRQTSALLQTLQALIDAAVAAGGSYYLCYGRFARQDQFVSAYGSDRIQAFKAIRKAADPGHKFSNGFLEAYLQEVSGSSL